MFKTCLRYALEQLRLLGLVLVIVGMVATFSASQALPQIPLPTTPTMRVHDGSDPSVTPSGGEAVTAYGPSVVTADDMSRLIRDQIGKANPVETADLPQSPMASPSWQAAGMAGGSPADVQIAVSHSHVVLTTNTYIAYYTKAGATVGGTDVASFFQPLQPYGSASLPAITRYLDLRVIFDSYRNRFWVVATGGTQKADIKNNVNADPAKWRSVIAVGVSKTENPLDGWYLYWWYAVAHWGQNDGVYQAGDVPDYPSIGIDPFGFHWTISVSNQQIVNGEIQTKYRYWHVRFFSADQMAKGGSSVGGWEYYDLKNPDGSMAGLIQPVVHHGPTGRAYYVSRYGSNELLIWALTNPLTPSQKLDRVEVTVTAFNPPQNAPQKGSSALIRMDNLGTDVMKAVYRFGQLVLVTHDARDWFGDGQMLTSVRLVRLFVLAYPNIPTKGDPSFIDYTIGKNSAIDDKPSDHMYYGWPAVEINKNHDMVVVYARSGKTIYPEVRFNLYRDTDPDIRPSRLLKTGEAAYDCGSSSCRWGDTAGASVDPSDDTAVWIAQEYANRSGGYSIWVGKVNPTNSRARSSAAGAIRVPDLQVRSIEARTLDTHSLRFIAEGQGIASIEVQVFDLSGKLVFDQKATGTTLDFRGLAADGRPLANGVYLYTVSVRGTDGRVVRSEVRKLVLLR